MIEVLHGENLKGANPSGEPLKDSARIKHGFFTRKGGVSDGIYASLNCGFGSADAQANVTENRRRVAGELGVASSHLITPYQTHSADVVIATIPWNLNDAPKADAIVTQRKGLAVGILSADCTPVLFADFNAGIIGAAHAGWRGAIGGILEATLEAMVTEGADLSSIQVSIGPCLHQASFEVGPEFEEQFIETAPEYAQFFTQKTNNIRPQFDLPGFIMHRLSRAGVIGATDLASCTYLNESLFYSYRRNTHKKLPDYGRQISAIVLT